MGRDIRFDEASTLMFRSCVATAVVPATTTKPHHTRRIEPLINILNNADKTATSRSDNAVQAVGQNQCAINPHFRVFDA